MSDKCKECDKTKNTDELTFVDCGIMICFDCVVSCACGHSGCKECLQTLKCCDEYVCLHCSYTCENCDKLSCLRCSYNEDDRKQSCKKTCECCCNHMCMHCQKKCEDCHYTVCDKCATMCEDCGTLFYCHCGSGTSDKCNTCFVDIVTNGRRLLSEVHLEKYLYNDVLQITMDYTKPYGGFLNTGEPLK